jgi:subtilase family serine protease
VGHRGVPDIAADADPFTGVLIVLNGVIQPYLIGGTSLATPLSAGMTTTVQSTVPTFTIGDLAPTLYLLYYYYPSYFYVTQSTLPLQSYLLTGIPNFMFESYGGQNGVYYVILGQWNPVNGLGQINVYGLDGALKLISHR